MKINCIFSKVYDYNFVILSTFYDNWPMMKILDYSEIYSKGYLCYPK